VLLSLVGPDPVDVGAHKPADNILDGTATKVRARIGVRARARVRVWVKVRHPRRHCHKGRHRPALALPLLVLPCLP
tara:strand:- start:671 stop:898 length:228 start_codon:yes stop_codon:yes gene_type:complete